jgi:hypothetical protein
MSTEPTSRRGSRRASAAPIEPEQVTVTVPTSSTIFDIDWKNPTAGLTKIALLAQSIPMLNSNERLILIQGGMMQVLQLSSLSDEEKATARTVIEKALPALLELVEKKSEALSALSTQPTIIVKNVEAMLAEVSTRKWWCC